jgi:MFS transporter, DHA2 family, metal-tetracycline-proton antiporter
MRELIIRLKVEKVYMKKAVPWIIYLIFFAVLNETVFNVSTPNISEQFGLSPSGVSWMMTIFLVFFGIGSVIYGRLADLYSLKRLIVIGLIIYNTGSLMGFLLRFSYPLVILARAIQGIGGSAIPALIFVAVARYFTPSERGKIFGLITSTVSLGIGLGPVIGGFVSASLHWYYLFLIPFLMLIAIPFLIKALPEEPNKEGEIDIRGAILVAITVGLFVVYLNFGQWYYLAGFLSFMALFIYHILTNSDPFINPSLFRNIQFRNGVIVGFSLFSIVIGILFIIPLMLHEVYALNTRQIGLVLFPGAISAVFFGPLGGNLADRKGNNFVVLIGLIFLMGSILVMSILLSLSFYVIVFALLLTYIGFSFFQTAMINGVSQTLQENETGVGMGVFNLVATLSGAVGTAIAGKILDGKWLEFGIFPIASNPKAYAYSNILLIFSLVILLGGILYFYSFRNFKVIEPLKNQVSPPENKT